MVMEKLKERSDEVKKYEKNTHEPLEKLGEGMIGSKQWILDIIEMIEISLKYRARIYQ